MQTQRAYYDDCYTSRFHAEVLEVDGRRVYLDRTFFYPTSGGQPHDVGLIGSMPVVEVIDEESRIAHIVGDAVVADPVVANLGKGQELCAGPVECRLDWGRRLDHMQQHTGQHLLSAVFAELFGLATLSFHMGADVSTIELEAGRVQDAQLEAAERRANEIVSEARTVRIGYEDAGETSGLRKASARTGVLRIVTIDSYDRSACGGTHVRNTAEIGPIQIRHLERIRGNTRLEFVCGNRALRQSKEDFQILSRVLKVFAVQPAALEEHLAGLRMRVESAEKALAKAKLEVAQLEAERLYRETAVSADNVRRCVWRVAELSSEGRALAIAFAAKGAAAGAVVPVALPGTVLLACSPDSGLNAGALWKAAFAEGGGRGGGSATLAQGQVTDAAALERFLRSGGFDESE